MSKNFYYYGCKNSASNLVNTSNDYNATRGMNCFFTSLVVTKQRVVKV